MVEEYNHDDNVKLLRTIAISVVVLIIILLMFLNPIQAYFKELDFDKDVRMLVEGIGTQEYHIEVLEDKVVFNIAMSSSFEDKEYNEKKDIILKNTNDLEALYNDHRNQMGDYNVELPYIVETKFKVLDKTYEKDGDTTIERDGIDYRIEDSIKEIIIGKLNVSELANKEEIIEILNKNNYSEESSNQINSIVNSSEMVNEIIYQTANLYKESDYKKSLEYFNRILEYKDVNNIVEEINQSHMYDGTWLGNGELWWFDNNTAYQDLPEYYNYNYLKYNIHYQDGKMYIYEVNKNNSKYVMEYKDSLLVVTEVGGDYTFSLKKMNTAKTKPDDEQIKKEPYIGMKEEDVEKSTWGEPEDINKTTTAYGTREQWCYSGYRYIYIENGVITSIRE